MRPQKVERLDVVERVDGHVPHVHEPQSTGKLIQHIAIPSSRRCYLPGTTAFAPEYSASDCRDPRQCGFGDSPGYREGKADRHLIS
eukprot:1567966-Rhodomonas_salina.1